MPSVLWNHRGLYFDFHFSSFRVGITRVYHFPFLLFLIAQFNQGMCKLETLFRCRGSLGASGHASALQKSSGTCFWGKISVQIWQPRKAMLLQLYTSGSASSKAECGFPSFLHRAGVCTTCVHSWPLITDRLTWTQQVPEASSCACIWLRRTEVH